MLFRSLGVVHASANVKVAHGAAGSVVAFACVAVLSMCASFVLYVAVVPGSQAASLASLGLLLFAVDALFLLPGNIVGETGLLRRLHDLRCGLVPLAAALLVPFIGTLAASVTGNQRWLRHGRTAGAVALVGGFAVCVASASSWTYAGYARRFASDGFATPGLIIVGLLSLALIRLGLLILGRTGAPAPLVFALLSLIATWGGQFNPLVFAVAPLAICGAMTMASMESSAIEQRTRNQQGLRRRPSRTPARSRSSIGGAA